MLQVRVHPFSEVFKYLKKRTVVKPVLSSTVLLTICLMLKLCASCGKSDYLKKWKIELSLNLYRVLYHILWQITIYSMQLGYEATHFIQKAENYYHPRLMN